MAHFAQLDENNLVLQVIVVHNNELMDNGVESEAKGIALCQSLFLGTNWKQTSYNRKFRKNYAGIGYSYREDIDAFVAPKPYPSWILDADARWQPPIPRPNDGSLYAWNEATTSWIFVTSEP